MALHSSSEAGVATLGVLTLFLYKNKVRKELLLYFYIKNKVRHC